MDQSNEPIVPTTVKKQEEVAETFSTAFGTLKTTHGAMRNLATLTAASGRAAVTGMVEIDRLLLEAVAAGVSASVSHGRAIMGAPSLEVVADVQKEFVSTSMTASAERSKDLIDLVRAKTLEIWTPWLTFNRATAQKLH